MSVRAITWAWEQQIPPNGKILLVALADHAHDDGRNSYPSVATLCRKTGLSRSTIQRMLSSLVTEGVIRVQQTGGADGHTPTVYALNIEESFAISKQEFNRSFCPPGLRAEVIVRDKMVCQLDCGKPGTEDADPEGNPWEVDRIEAGGRYVEGNVRLACRSCNRRRWRHREGPHDEAPTPDRGLMVRPQGPQKEASGASSVRPEPTTEPTTTTEELSRGVRTSNARPSRIPSDWKPSPETVTVVREHYPSLTNDQLNRAWKRFVLHHRSRGDMAADWDAGFVMWVDADAEREVKDNPPDVVRFDDVTGLPINPKPMRVIEREDA